MGVYSTNVNTNKITIYGKDIWYWTAISMLLGSAFLSMYLSNAYSMIAVAIPLILLDRAWVVPTLLYIAAIEGSFKVEDAASEVESTVILAIMPLFIYDFITNLGKKTVPGNITWLYLVFSGFVFMGMYTYSTHPQIMQSFQAIFYKKTNLAIYIQMFMKFVKLVFFFLYLNVLINRDKNLIYRALNLMKDMTPYLIMLVALNMYLFGTVSEKFGTIHFGDAHHGDFSANMCALGVFIYIGMFEKDSNMFKRAMNFIALLALAFIVMELASRNGLLCYILIGVLGGYLGIYNHNLGFKTLIVISAIVVFAALIYLFKDSPTVQRFIAQTEAGGGDRLSYWSAGLDGLQEEPFFGLGGSTVASMYAVSRYAPWVEDHVMHNTFVEFVVEFGIFGLIFYLIFQCVILYHAYKNFFYALKLNDVLLAAPSISYFTSIFAGLFISRVWESTLWYDMTLIFAIYILWRKPLEEALKKRKTALIHGHPDPLNDESLIRGPHDVWKYQNQ